LTIFRVIVKIYLRSWVHKILSNGARCAGRGAQRVREFSSGADGTIFRLIMSICFAARCQMSPFWACDAARGAFNFNVLTLATNNTRRRGIPGEIGVELADGTENAVRRSSSAIASLPAVAAIEHVVVQLRGGFIRVAQVLAGGTVVTSGRCRRSRELSGGASNTVCRGIVINGGEARIS
jgi:hypothetical protein